MGKKSDTPRPFGSIVGTHQQLERHGFTSSIGFGSSNLLTSPSSSSFVSRTATEQSTIIVEKRDERDQVVEISPVKSIVYVKSGSLLGPPSLACQNSNNSIDVVLKTTTTATTASSAVENQKPAIE